MKDYEIYTLNGKELLNRGKTELYRDALRRIKGMENMPKSFSPHLEYNIDLSNEYENAELLLREEESGWKVSGSSSKNESSFKVVKEETELYHQVDLLLRENDDRRSVNECVIIIDFGNLFMGLEKDSYFKILEADLDFEEKKPFFTKIEELSKMNEGNVAIAENYAGALIDLYFDTITCFSLPVLTICSALICISPSAIRAELRSKTPF